MNSDEALRVIDTLISTGKVVRVSSVDRVTKGLVFRTATNRHFAVALNSGAAQDPARGTRVVFEKAPGTRTLDWSIVGKMLDVELSDGQAQSSFYRLSGANLSPGMQTVTLVKSEAALLQLIDWYADVAPLTSMPVFERAAVEAAMARYDELGPAGFAAAYPALDGPVDYWVRPSRQRAHSCCPSTAIAALALGVPSLDGGWARPDTAASLLHNLGYIIVDETGHPAPVPADEYPHLISGADHIRACALTNYIAPARDRGDASVAIVAGKLNNEMGLSQGWSSVCSAVGGRIFAQYASVPLPERNEGADKSTTTTFTFHFRNTTTTMPPPIPLRQT